jgi:FkbH-like protein
MTVLSSAGPAVREAETDGSRPAGRTLDEAIASAIGQVPDGVRRRLLLSAVDWSRIDADDVRRLLADMAQRKQSMPRAVANALLLAGHVLPADVPHGPAARALNTLNRIQIAADAAVSDLSHLAESADLDPDIAQAIVKRLVRLGAVGEACRLALALWARLPQALGPVRSELASHLDSLPPLRVRLAGFSTIDTLADDLVPAFARAGRHARVGRADFGTGLAALLEPEAEADAHILLLDLDGFAPCDWRRPAAQIQELLGERIDALSRALAAYARHTPAPLMVNTIPSPAGPTAGLIDGRHPAGLRRAVALINQALLEAAERHTNIVLVDADQALADIAPSRRHDPKLWFYGRVAYAAEATRALAAALAEAWALSARGPAKVLALDLDNTLWGGVYGDDGIERLACGEDFPGNAFRAFQEECLRLKRQGLLLVALSKNNADAATVFERHPGMALRSSDFVASAINWEPKPGNIRELAHDLNLGLDSFVFIDDSPHEREAMRRLVPEVIVPELPDDPARRPAWLRRLACTWAVRLTEEDERRSEMYAAERGARALRASAATVEDYLRGLEQRLIVSTVGTADIPRVAQMHQRTNQFNLTTRRLTEADIAACVNDPARGMAVAGRVADKFGDHGLAITATVSIDGERAEIGTFLMSCRVIGREIERAFLGTLLRLLAERGIARVTGRFVATIKNGMVREFYPAHGFALVDGTDEASSWVFDLSTQKPPATPLVSVSVEA